MLPAPVLRELVRVSQSADDQRAASRNSRINRSVQNKQHDLPVGPSRSDLRCRDDLRVSRIEGKFPGRR